MKHENWAVQCPTDYATNEKWKEIVKWLNEKYENHLNGDSIGRLYYVEDNNYDYKFTKPSSCTLLSIDEAHDMLFGNPVKYTIYQELRLLKFKQTECNDNVFFDIEGVHPYYMKLKCTKHSFLIWTFSIPALDLIEYWVDGIKVSTMKVEQVKEFLTKIETK